MRKIKDERLKLQNLKNIRIAFIVQSLGILAILVYDLIKFGFNKVFSNPLWLVFIMSGIVVNYLSMSISVDEENDSKNPKARFLISLVVLCIIALVIGFFIHSKGTSTMLDVLVPSGIIFISGLIPSIYIYRLRLKNYEAMD